MSEHRDGDEPRAHPWVWAVMALLFIVSVPWYLPAEPEVRLWFGLPHWVVISLSAYVAVAVFTAWIVARHWPDTDTEEDEDEAAP